MFFYYHCFLKIFQQMMQLCDKFYNLALFYNTKCHQSSGPVNGSLTVLWKVERSIFVIFTQWIRHDNSSEWLCNISARDMLRQLRQQEGLALFLARCVSSTTNRTRIPADRGSQRGYQSDTAPQILQHLPDKVRVCTCTHVTHADTCWHVTDFSTCRFQIGTSL